MITAAPEHPDEESGVAAALNGFKRVSSFDDINLGGTAGHACPMVGTGFFYFVFICHSEEGNARRENPLFLTAVRRDCDSENGINDKGIATVARLPRNDNEIFGRKNICSTWV